MCLAMNADKLGMHERCASTSNRNFEGRISPDVRANYLASPPLVVAYAIAGTIRFDIENDVLGLFQGREIRLKDIWPSDEEIDAVAAVIVSKVEKASGGTLRG